MVSTWNIFFLVHLLVSILVGTIMTISKDRVKPSPFPDSWKLSEIFATGIVLGSYLALMTVVFFYIVVETDFFPVSIFFSSCPLRFSFIQWYDRWYEVFFPRTNLAWDTFIMIQMLRTVIQPKVCWGLLSIFKLVPLVKP